MSQQITTYGRSSHIIDPDTGWRAKVTSDGNLQVVVSGGGGGGGTGDQGEPNTPDKAWPIKSTDAAGVNQQAITSAGDAKVTLDGETVAIAGTVPVSGPLTDGQLRASAVPVSTGLTQPTTPADTQPVSGTVAVSNFPGTQPVSGTVGISGTVPVSGPLTDAQLRATSVPVSTGLTPLTDAQLRATSVPVSTGLTQPLTDTQLRASAVPVSGPLTDTQLRASAVPISAPTLTKGTQGANGFSVQNLTDAGRTYVTLTALSMTGVTSEAMASLTPNKQGVTSAGATSYTITSGKTLRITAIVASLRSQAAAIAFALLKLRHNTAGATTTASPMAIALPEMNTNSATSGTGATIVMPIPDGIEFYGNGTQSIGLSHVDQATTNLLNITIYGYEY